MGTEVLRPYDFLAERIRGPPAMVYPRRRNAYNNHYNKPIRSKPVPVRSDQKKTSESSPAILRRFSSDDLRQSKQNHDSNRHNQLLKGQITILKRGEQLDRTERLRPDPSMVKNQIRIKDPKTEFRSRSLSPKPVAGGLPDVYAGSAFSFSPSPESLPLPSFSKRKQVSMTVDDSATKDLRRLLRLD